MQPPSGILCTPVTPGKSYRIFLTVFFVAAVKKKKGFCFPKHQGFVDRSRMLRWSALVCRVVTRQVARVEPPVG